MRDSKAPLIAFFGPDGSGKSTIVDLLLERSAKSGVRLLRMHWRPGVIPYRGNILEKNGTLFSDPHSTKVRRGTRALLIFLTIIIDFLLGYYLVVRPCLKNSTTVLYERYYYDIVVDQKRYGLQVPLWLRCYFAHLLPVPDIIILLDGAGPVLYQRKREISPVEIDRQRTMMKQFLCRFNAVHIIDVTKNSPDEIIDRIVQIFTERSFMAFL